MAKLNASQVIRTFGSPQGENRFFEHRGAAPTAEPMINPQPVVGREPGGANVANDMQGVGPTQTPQTTPQADVGGPQSRGVGTEPNQQIADIFGRLYEQARQQQPNDTGGGSVPTQDAVVGGASYGRPRTNPQLQVPEGYGNLPQFGGGAGGGQFTPQGGATQLDPQLLAALQGRAQGEGMVGLEQVLEGVGRPELALIDREFSRGQEQLLQDLVERGVLSSSEARNQMGRLAEGFANQKGALLGRLGLQHEQMKQANINQAFQNLTGLELGRVQADTAITTANIGAAAQVQSASIQAAATTQSAQIRSQAQLQSAQLAAQAALQQAGMDFDVAMKRLDQNMSLQGIDPVRFESDPLYRSDMLDYLEQRQKAKDLLIEAQILNLTGMTLPEPAGA